MWLVLYSFPERAKAKLHPKGDPGGLGGRKPKDELRLLTSFGPAREFCVTLTPWTTSPVVRKLILSYQTCAED